MTCHEMAPSDSERQSYFLLFGYISIFHTHLTDTEMYILNWLCTLHVSRALHTSLRLNRRFRNKCDIVEELNSSSKHGIRVLMLFVLGMIAKVT